MGFFSNISTGLRALFGRTRVEREMDEELTGFLTASAEANQRSGMSPEAAARAARIEMGSTNAVKHHIRSTGWETAAENLWLDLRYSVRMLLKSPGFTLVAILSLALGIGANTAIFTLINNVIMQQLPVRQPGELVSFGKSLSGGLLGGVDLSFFDMYGSDFANQLEKNPGPFAGVFSYDSRFRRVGVQIGEHPTGPSVQIQSHMVSGGYFNTLATPMFLGRGIQPYDASAPGRSPVVVVSYHYWRDTLEADSHVLGKIITLNGVPCNIVGVAPPRFYGIMLGTEPPDIWAPLTMQAELMHEPSNLAANGPYWLHMAARLAPGHSVQQDQIWLNDQIHAYVLSHEGGQVSADRRAEIGRINEPLVPAGSGVSGMRQGFEGPLLVLMCVVVLVLLVACANLANFLLARATARQREISTRLALGSTRMRIVRQILMEALLLSAAGGLCGLALAWVATRALIRFVAGGVAYTSLSATPDLRVLAFTFAVALLTGLLFGLAPALRVARADAAPALNANARTAAAAGGSGGRLLPRALVIGQVTASVVLLAAAGLFLRSLTNIEKQDFGFNRSNLLVVDFAHKFGDLKPQQLAGFYQQVQDRLNALPGIAASAFATTPPMSRGNTDSSVKVSGHVPAPKEGTNSILELTTPGYFQATGIPILQGRAIGSEDAPNGPKSIVVNRAFAEHYFPQGNALGHQVTIEDDDVLGPWQIVGVAANTLYSGPREEIQRHIYIPQQQAVLGEASYTESLIVRTTGDPAKMTSAVRQALQEIDPSLPILSIRTIGDLTDHFVTNEQLVSRLCATFSALAVLLAAIGLYGVMSYTVVRRTNEIGIRIALGAQTGNVLWMVLRESLVLLAVGLALGLPIALGGLHSLQSQLYQLSSSDPVTMIGSVLIIAAVTVLAAWLPARRASHVDPMVALRCD